MKSEKIFEALTEIEDKYIDEAKTEKIRFKMQERKN